MRGIALALLLLATPVASYAATRGGSTAAERGAPGPQGDPGPKGAPGASITGPKGDTGAQGNPGPTGPKSSVFVCNATITETVALAVSAGIRVTPEIACTGVLTTDILEVYPTSLTGLSTQVLGAPVSNGTAVHHAIPTAAGKFRGVVSIPAIALGNSYSIPVAVYAVGR